VYAVNKNLGVAGFMSADQKKRLLWGSKKVPTEQVKALKLSRHAAISFKARVRIDLH
jgi:hypothetical protein